MSVVSHITISQELGGVSSLHYRGKLLFPNLTVGIEPQPLKKILATYDPIAIIQSMNKFNTQRFMKPVKQSAPYGTGYSWLGYFYGFTG